MKIIYRLIAESRGLTLAVVVVLFGCNSAAVGPQSVAGTQPVGSVHMLETQAAYLSSGSAGNGTLFFKGESYPFSIAGLGPGGMGLSMLSAPRQVYGLRTLDTFPGSYTEAPTLLFDSQRDPFSVSESGILAILATFDARGEVYGLKALDAFPGTYIEARYGARRTGNAGDLWLQNENYVVLHLKTNREGLVLSLGGPVAICMRPRLRRGQEGHGKDSSKRRSWS
jgi:hypothetical protein